MFLLVRIQNLVAWRQQLESRFGKFSIVLPLLSLLWGIVSAVFLVRDYAHSNHLAAALGALIVFSVFLKLWFHGLSARWSARWQERLLPMPEAAEGSISHALWALVLKPQAVESLALQVNQSCVQYVTMFCMPLLYAAGSYGTLALTLAVGATSLWDDWWARLAPKTWYMAAIRGCVVLLAVSYSFPVFFPRAFSYFYLCMALATLLAVIPWSALFPPRKPLLGELAIVAAVVVAMVIQFFLGEWIRIPVLSVWVRHPAIGIEAFQSGLGEKWPRKISRERLEKAVAQGSRICCLTPLVSPSGMIATVAHEWLVNGERIDYIPLGRIRTTDKTELMPYRTFSCKQNFPRPRTIVTLECRVYLDETVDIGGARLRVGTKA